MYQRPDQFPTALEAIGPLQLGQPAREGLAIGLHAFPARGLVGVPAHSCLRLGQVCPVAVPQGYQFRLLAGEGVVVQAAGEPEIQQRPQLPFGICEERGHPSDHLLVLAPFGLVLRPRRVHLRKQLPRLAEEGAQPVPYSRLHHGGQHMPPAAGGAPPALGIGERPGAAIDTGVARPAVVALTHQASPADHATREGMPAVEDLAQQVLPPAVPPGRGLPRRQHRRGPSLLLFGHDRGDGYQDPVGAGPLGVGGPLQLCTLHPGPDHVLGCPTIVGRVAAVGGVPHHVADRSAGPGAAPGRGDPGGYQIRRDPARGAAGQDVIEHAAHDTRLLGDDLQGPVLLARGRGDVAVAERPPPSPQVALGGLVQLAAPRPLLEIPALVFGHGTLQVGHQAARGRCGVVALVQGDERDTRLLELPAQDQQIQGVAGKPVERQYVHTAEPPGTGVVPQPIERRAVEGGAGDPVVRVELVDRLPVPRGTIVEGGYLALDGPVLLLLLARDAGVEGDHPLGRLYPRFLDPHPILLLPLCRPAVGADPRRSCDDGAGAVGARAGFARTAGWRPAPQQLSTGCLARSPASRESDPLRPASPILQRRRRRCLVGL